MCNCNKNVLVFNMRNGNYCVCCGENQDNPSTGIDLPSGGANGDVLAKQDSGLIWKENSGAITGLQTIKLPISLNGQTQFVNAIPEGKNVLNLFVEGFQQDLATDYTINGRTINWVNSGFPLKTIYRLSINVY